MADAHNAMKAKLAANAASKSKKSDDDKKKIYKAIATRAKFNAIQNQLYLRHEKRTMNTGDLLWLERIVNEHKQQDRYEDANIYESMRQSGIQAQQIGQADEPSEEAEEVTVSKESAGDTLRAQPQDEYESARPPSALGRPLSAAERPIVSGRPVTASSRPPSTSGRPGTALLRPPSASQRFNETLPESQVSSQMTGVPRVSSQPFFRSLQKRYAFDGARLGPNAVVNVPPQLAPAAVAEAAPLESPIPQIDQSEQQRPIGLGVYDTHGAGVLVREVLINSPAARAGLRVGDTIRYVNKQPVRTLNEFERELSFSTGPYIKLWVARVGVRRNLNIVVLR
jgi:hypothetical protein